MAYRAVSGFYDSDDTFRYFLHNVEKYTSMQIEHLKPFYLYIKMYSKQQNLSMNVLTKTAFRASLKTSFYKNKKRKNTFTIQKN